MGIAVVGLPSNRKTPGYYMSVLLGTGGSSPSQVASKARIIGNMIATALTGANPAFTVPAGTYTTGGASIEAPVQIFGADDAKVRFGQGSELHLRQPQTLVHVHRL